MSRPTVQRPTVQRPTVQRPPVQRPIVIRPGGNRPGGIRPPQRPNRPAIIDIPSVKVPLVQRPNPLGGAPSVGRPSVDFPLNLGGGSSGDKPSLGDRPLGKLPPQVGPNGIPLDALLAGKFAVGKDGKLKNDALLGKFIPGFQNKLTNGKFDKLTQLEIGKKFKLAQQFKLMAGGGDLAVQLGLHKKLLVNAGWQHAACYGPITPGYVGGCFGGWYAGPCYYPSYCWHPHWCGWVNWCWWDFCHPICDPRPIWCQPIICQPCPAWTWWHCPVWTHLPVVTCGTWVNVPQVVVPVSESDLQLLAVRFVDPGHAEQNLGPRYRVWIRNNTPDRALGNFNVMLFASNDVHLANSLPQGGSRIEFINAGEIKAIDVRLPASANELGRDSEGRAIPFSQLHVLVDSHREVFEAFEDNNGSVLTRAKILPVDPAAFALDATTAAPGAALTVAGEGFGPLPGQVVVVMDGLQLQAKVEGWYDLGVRFQLPELPLAGAADAEVIVLRRDGAAAHPLTVRVEPAAAIAGLPAAQP